MGQWLGMDTGAGSGMAGERLQRRGLAPEADSGSGFALDRARSAMRGKFNVEDPAKVKGLKLR